MNKKTLSLIGATAILISVIILFRHEALNMLEDIYNEIR